MGCFKEANVKELAKGNCYSMKNHGGQKPHSSFTNKKMKDKRGASEG